MNPDQDLHEHFKHQRHADREHVPAWNPDLLRASPKRSSWHLPFWLPITAAACVLLSFVGLRHDAPTTDLVASLPEFFATQGEPLFANVETVTSAPSDSFLPIHLTIQLP